MHMIDPTRTAVGESLLLCLQNGTVKAPSELIPEQLSVSNLGVGESYAAWLVSDGLHSWVFRLPRRPADEMPCSMSDELAAAQFISEEVGARAVAMDDSCENALGCPYIVSSYAPGAVLSAADWNEQLLRQHAHQLAMLHSPTFTRAGRLGSETSTVDIVREFDDGFRWWQESHAEITDDNEVTSLAHDIREQLVNAAPSFEGIPYSFIHGDLVVTNVVVDAEGKPRYIDWEWARIGDVAQDLAYIGGQVTGGPWYARMDAKMVTALLTDYQAACVARSGADEPVEPLERLRTRRDAWELTERFLSSLHFSKQSGVVAEASQYADAVRELRMTLRARLNDLQRGRSS